MKTLSRNDIIAAPKLDRTWMCNYYCVNKITYLYRNISEGAAIQNRVLYGVKYIVQRCVEDVVLQRIYFNLKF
jgi:hypothetical protein